MAKTWWRPETGIFLALWLLLMIGGRSRFFQDPGTFWHTVVGQQMLSTGQLIYHDTFSFTFAGHPWSPHQWLGECIMALLHQIDELDTLLLATVTVLTCLYTWLAHRLIRGGLHWSLAALLVGFTVAASSSHFHVRAHIATIVFLGLTYGYLVDFEAGRTGLRSLFWLVPIYALWTNLHGGLLGGLATMGFAWTGWCCYRIVRRPSPITDYRQAVTFIGLIAACGLTILVNPYGLRMPQIWMEIMNGDLPTIIQEHAPLNPARPDGWMVLLFGLFYGLVLVNVRPQWPRVTWLLPLIWFYLACGRIRHAPLFSITAAVAIADMLPHTRWAARMVRTGSDLFQFPRETAAAGTSGPAWRWGFLPAGLIVVALFCQAARVPVPVVGHGWAQLDRTYWPVDLVADLRVLEGSGSTGVPIFNEYLFGGFLIYHTPGLRVFVDDRCELYGDQWLHDYVRAERDDTTTKIHEWEARYPPFDIALTQTGSGFDTYFGHSDEWVAIRRTETASLYRRNPIICRTGSAVGRHARD
jgi:hypothetical protein